MKKFVAISLIMAGMVLVGGVLTLTQAQTPGIDAKPTFLSPTPGLYVNGWPLFAVSYPKEWAAQPLGPNQVCRVAAPRPSLPPSPSLTISVFPGPGEISGSADLLAGFLPTIGGKDVKILYDKPAKLQDGAPAQEAEVEWVPAKGPKLNTYRLASEKDGIWIWGHYGQ